MEISTGYDPVKDDNILDDNSLPILAESYWRTITEAEEQITLTFINWYWDGEGMVCLSYDRFLSDR